MRRTVRIRVLRLALVALVLPLAAACAVDALSPAATGTARPGATKPAAAATAAPAPLPACAPPYPAGAPTADSVLCADPARMQAGRVIRIVDGDTLHVELDGRDETVRLYGINATEVGQPCSAEATARLRALAGTQVRLVPDARDRDRYGRLLRYVYTPDGRSVDAEIVAEGLAHAWTSDGALRGAIIALEARARSGHVGCLWTS